MNWNRIRTYGIILLLFGIVFLSGCRKKTEPAMELQDMPAEESVYPEEETHGTVEMKEEKQEELFCYVHICGEVENPGVYRLKSGDRVYQAVELAGGFTPLASEGYVNQAETVRDGMKIVVPAAGAEGEAEAQAGIEDTSGSLVNINTASKERLCTLNGIGESRAESIIAYREKNGAFSKIEDIMKVDGIKEGAFAKIRESISVQ